MTKWSENVVAGLPKLPTGQPIAHHMVKAEDLPFTVELFDENTGEMVWETTVHRPDVLTVPSFYPRRICVLVSYLRSGARVLTTADGQSVYEKGPRE